MSKIKEPKILGEGESTFRNGGTDPNMGAICGGVISQSLMFSDVDAYMMAWYLPDKYFAKYKDAKEKGDKKRADYYFKRYARSMI